MGNNRPHTLPAYVIYGSFTLGLLTAIAFRTLIVLERAEPDWVRPVWYFAVGGNLLFFFYRYIITRRRKKTVERFGLIRKIEENAPLKEADREALIYLLQSIKLSPENLNYIIISIFSAIAIAADLAFVYLW